MPQMDPGYLEEIKKLLKVGKVQKELVDPYCTVQFAGHKEKTKVSWNEQVMQTSTMYYLLTDPEWNQQINLPIRAVCLFSTFFFHHVHNCKIQFITHSYAMQH